MSLLFTQLAVAAYACPSMAMMTDSIQMQDCNGMDASQKSLCHEHAKNTYKKQSLDKPASPEIPAFDLHASALTLIISDQALFLMPIVTPLLITRTTSPPLAIRHCCFRI